MQQVARAGGRPKYKIGSNKTDQGTEFKGAYKDASMNGKHGDEVWQTGGDASRHECCAQIENGNKWIAVEATAMSLEGTENEDQIVAVSGKSTVAARQVLNHTIRGEVQKKEGKSGWELHSGVQGSAEWPKNKPKSLSQVYCMIKKKNR